MGVRCGAAGSSWSGSGGIAFLETRVAKWWLPDDVVFVEELPHGATGNVSKRTLREPFADYELPG